MPREQTRICYTCGQTLKLDWEVCPFCGALQDIFDDAGREAEAAEGHPPAGTIIEYEPAENEQITSTPPAPLPARRLTPGSVPSGADLYAIMRLSLEEINISELGRGLAGILGRPMADVTCPLQATKGFIARRVPQSALCNVARLLDKLGIESVAFAEGLVAPLPPIYRTAGISFSTSRFTCAAISPSDKTWNLTFATDRVRLVVTGRVMYSARITVERPLYDPFRNSALLKKRYLKPEHSRKDSRKEIHVHDYLIYLFLTTPERLLLIKDSTVDYDKMERLASDTGKMQEYARLLVERLGLSLHDNGLRLLAELDEDDPSWAALTFATPRGIEGYAQWRYNVGLVEE